MNGKKPVLPTLKLVGELLVVDAEHVHDGCVQVMHMYGIFHDVVAKVIRLAMDMSRLYSGAREQRGEAIRMMISSPVLALRLSVYRSAELAAPNDECVVQ